MEFSNNHLTKFYWAVLLVLFLPILSMPDSTMGMLIILVAYFIIIAGAVHSMTRKITVAGSRLTQKNIFKEDSIRIIPESKIYICQNLQSFYFLYRHYNYSIKIINPNQALKINANVNNADDLYHLVAQLEQTVVLPVLLERFIDKGSIQMDDALSMNKTGLSYKNKTYSYDKLSAIELKNGHLHLMANGKLWQSSVLVLPVANIPNLRTFMTLLNQNEMADHQAA